MFVEIQTQTTSDMAASQAPGDDEDDDVEQLQYKIIILGDGAVGTRFILIFEPFC